MGGKRICPTTNSETAVTAWVPSGGDSVVYEPGSSGARLATI